MESTRRTTRSMAKKNTNSISDKKNESKSQKILIHSLKQSCENKMYINITRSLKFSLESR